LKATGHWWQNGVLVLKRASLGFVLALTLLSTASAGASSTDASASGGGTARAYGVKVIVPGGGAGTPTVAAPPDAVQFSGGFVYGTDNAVSTGSANASVSATVDGPAATATASAEVSGLSLFGGEITADSISAHATASARPGAATGDTNGSAVTNLVALGQAVASGGSATLADWGTLRTLEAGASGSASTGYRGFVTAVDIHLTADHGGLPAGTSILLGYAEVAAQAGTATPTPVPKPKPVPKKGASASGGKAPEPPPIPSIRRPPNITPPLKTPGGYVFPVYGPSSFVDTFGAGRGDVSGGWHHGDDIFAPLGAPILAVASGTVFSVGWNSIGGNRLWVRDGQGNLFYYAHLSAFSPLAVNGNQVDAGDVLGFVGNTGDARGTPYHLHFEIHPVGLLGMGYDGAVDPTSYLTAWKHLQDVSFAGGNAWAPFRGASQAPKPGAILISVNDISTADGLDPGSLQRAMAPAVTEGSPLPLPNQPERKPAAGQPTAAGTSP
jgi:murein DD-endopeptidase MepM/ murein hydrolase activator NlpD